MTHPEDWDRVKILAEAERLRKRAAACPTCEREFDDTPLAAKVVPVVFLVILFLLLTLAIGMGMGQQCAQYKGERDKMPWYCK